MPVDACKMIGCLDRDQHLLAVGHEAVQVLDEAAIPHLIGGGVALWAYGRRRNTKDIDLFVSTGRQIEALDALARRGFHTRETDANWLFKAEKHDVSIDIIVYTTGNFRVTAQTLARARRQEIDGLVFNLMGPEDLLIRKIHSTSELRFHDWYDALSVVVRQEASFDWAYFLDLALADAVKRTISFAFFAIGDLGPGVIPDQVLDALLVADKRHSSSNTA